MISFDTMTGLRISLASPEQIRRWSSGEVTSPQTLNYRTLKPIKDGLFCERIFGPTKSWTCACGRYKRVRFKGVVCQKCGVTVTHSRVRRERMGHIELAAPVSHPWYAKGSPSRIALLLNISARHVNRLLSYVCYVVISIDEQARRDALSRLDEEIVCLSQNSKREDSCTDEENDLPIVRLTKLVQTREALQALHPLDLLEVDRYRELARTYGQVFRAGIGAGAVREILERLDLDQLSHDVRAELTIAEPPARKKIMRRLHLVEAFRTSHTCPAWMILTVLPVLPPDLRHVLQLESARLASADSNALYMRVISQNNRLKHLLQLNAPEIMLNNERRRLQEACNALFDHARQGYPKGYPIGGPMKQVLKSLSESLRGKMGRFRHSLLGKRVDYSGRSVIVVGPHLKLHQCGLPKKMALELFKPFANSKALRRTMPTCRLGSSGGGDGRSIGPAQPCSHASSSQYPGF